MFTPKCFIEIVELENEIKIAGRNLQSSGLPVTFDSLGKMWEKYPDNKGEIKNKSIPETEYGVSLNKVPDYIVGNEVTSFEDEENECYCLIIPAGSYIKIQFNGENHDSLVGEKLEKNCRLIKKWAKDNKIQIDDSFQAEVYPEELTGLEHPEMYCLVPVKKQNKINA